MWLVSLFWDDSQGISPLAICPRSGKCEFKQNYLFTVFYDLYEIVISISLHYINIYTGYTYSDTYDIVPLSGGCFKKQF